MSDRAQPSRVDLPSVVAAAALILAALMLGIASRKPGSVVPVCLFLVATVFVPERFRRDPHLIVYLLLGGVFALWQQSLDGVMTGLGATRVHGTFFAAQTCLSCGAAALFAPRSKRSRLGWAISFGAAALCFSGAGFPNWLARQNSWKQALPGIADHVTPRQFYAAAVFLYGTLAALTLRNALPHSESPPRARGLRAGLLLVTALGAVGLAEATALTLRDNYQEISSLYVRLARGLRLKASGGFSGQAELGDVLTEQGVDGGRGVALEVFAQEPPGYLRGRAFLRYTGRGWDVGVTQTGRPADKDELGRWVLPERGPPAPGAEPDLIVRPAARYEAVMFTPLDLQAVEGPSVKVVRHVGSILHSSEESTADGYRVWQSSAQVHAEAKGPATLELPEDPELLAAVDEHIAQAKLRGPDGKPVDPLTLVRRLATHFDRRYEYKFGIQFDDESDPLTQFLRVKKHGHCELFASSATLILRRLGVRARYVTGFVCTEQNEYDPELWIARNKMAHAWVEAYHPATGWKTLEFTPGSAIPQVGKASWSESFLEWLQGKWTRFKAIPWREVPVYLLGLLRGALEWLFGAWYRVLGLALLILGVVLWRRSRRPPPPPPPRVRAFPAALAEARETYLARESLLAEHDLGRAPAETLLAQAERLRASAWPEGLALDQAEVVAGIEEFAASRYGPSAGAGTSSG
jgi:protein-glutamine gamma-glutamyltransferase